MRGVDKVCVWGGLGESVPGGGSRWCEHPEVRSSTEFLRNREEPGEGGEVPTTREDTWVLL